MPGKRIQIHIPHILLVLVAIVLVVVGLFPPTPLAASVTNNLWSISYIHAAYQDDAHVQALTTPPATHAHGGLLLGIRAIQDEQYDQALQFLEPLLAKDDPIALDAYAQILFHLGETQGAIAIWQKLGNLVSLELAATQLYESGELEPAIQIWQFLYQDDPELYTSSLAFTLFVNGDNPQSIALLTDSMSQFPASEYRPAWGRYLGDNYKALKRYAEAEETYLAVLVQTPTETKTWRNLGFLYWELEEYEKAVVSFTSMSALDPADPYPFILIAQTYERSDERDKALAAWQQALTLDPQNAEALKAIDLLKQP